MYDPTQYRHELMRLAPKLLLCAGLVAFSSCSSCSSCGSTPKEQTEPKDTRVEGKLDPTTQSAEDLTRRAKAIVRVESLGNIEQYIELYLAEDESSDAPLRFSFKDPLRDWLGGAALDELRIKGNVELVWLEPESGDKNGEDDWLAVIPVEDVDAFFKARGAVDGVNGLMRWSALDKAVWAQTAPVEFERGQSSDPAPRILVANTPTAALHGQEFLKTHAREQKRHLQVHFWPSRLKVQDRWSRFGKDLSQRLAASGHGLVPGRATLINLESLLYNAMGDVTQWPEPLRFNANFKIRDGKPKAIRTYLHVPIPEGHALLEQVHDSLTPRKGGHPPVAAVDASGELRLRLDRTQLEDTFDTFLPERWRLMLASRGEDSMVALTGTAKDLLEYNRGPTLLAFYEQRVPLSGETLIAWEGMDLARVAEPAQKFVRAFIESFWAPLHLADTSAIKEAPFTDEERGLTGVKTTFDVRFGTQSATLGACWAANTENFFIYFGTTPCKNLVERVAVTTDQQPAAFSLEVDVQDTIDLLYMPPGARMKGTFKAGGERARLLINGYARDNGELEFESQIKDANFARSLLRNGEELSAVYGPIKEVDLGELLQRATMEQAIYQEPGITLVGPPGGIGAAPPAYFLGLPFSLAPAPPDQLKKSVLGDEPEKEKKQERAPKKPKQKPSAP